MMHNNNYKTIIVIGDFTPNESSPFTIASTSKKDITYITHIHKERIVQTFGKSGTLAYFILTESGALYASGANDSGSCGVDLFELVPLVNPIQVILPCRAVSAQTGMNFSIVLCEDGQ
jgi:alpha-tubulin suppressor-like RCC1 family protein